MDAIDLLVRKLSARDVLTNGEEAALRAAAGVEEAYAAGAEIVQEGAPQKTSRLLAAGMVARLKSLSDGRRQITEVHIPGDFVDLHSFTLKRLDHDIVALGPSRLIQFPHDGLRLITEREPHLTRLLWLNTLLDAAGHREWLLAAGRKTAIEHIASLFCELLARHQVVGLGAGGAMAFPMTQAELGDACGLSAVHVNRVIQELREMQLVEWRAGKLKILDRDRLAALGKFDPAFLVLSSEPR